MSVQGEIKPEWKYKDVDLLPLDPITGNAPITPQDHFVFSPLPAQPLSLEGAALVLLLIKLSKTPDGMKTLERLATKYLDSCARIVEAVEDACHTNWLTALNNQHIAAGIAHRIGLLDDGAFIKIMSHYQSVFDKMWQAQMTGQILEGVTTLVQGAKVGTGELGTGAAGIGAIAKIAGL